MKLVFATVVVYIENTYAAKPTDKNNPPYKNQEDQEL